MAISKGFKPVIGSGITKKYGPLAPKGMKRTTGSGITKKYGPLAPKKMKPISGKVPGTKFKAPGAKATGFKMPKILPNAPGPVFKAK